ncbi:MAG: hypothetical protein KDE26_07995, partial [Bacteroidetes bacterium]|nr:hypothetical protein [Bacteroidota bacterium]
QNLGIEIASSIAEPEKQITTGYQRIMGIPMNEKVKEKFMDLYYEANDLYQENPEYLTEFRCEEKWGTPSSEVAALTLVFNAMMNTDVFLNKF